MSHKSANIEDPNPYSLDQTRPHRPPPSLEVRSTTRQTTASIAFHCLKNKPRHEQNRKIERLQSAQY
ncbi:hypothetical protein GE21DRAFT_1278571, partial [Neurospora crassa]